MNQIPNVEETHNTREVEEIIEEKIEGYDEDTERHERTKQAIKNKEIVYIGEFGNVLCEEDYFAWEEWVDSVAIGGSSREKFIKVNLNLHHQLQKAQRCGKELPDGSICGCRLDCHLHDWRQREEIQKVRDEAIAREKQLKQIHMVELDAISCMSLEQYVAWRDYRKQRPHHSELNQDTPKE